MAFFNAFVGAETGILKGVDTEHKKTENLTSIRELSRDKEICVMCWSDSKQNQILLGLKNGMIAQYIAQTGELLELFNCRGDAAECQAVIKGIGTYEQNIITALDTGQVTVWNEQFEKLMEFNVGKDLFCLRQNPDKPNVLATGGKENDLKLWDLGSKDVNQPIFEAKNLANDWLNLRVPVWIQDILFAPDSDNMVVSTAYGKVRVYDPSKQKRPIIEVEFGEYPLTAMALYDKSNVIVGNTHGDMAMVNIVKGVLVHLYKGVGGSIKGLQCHPTLPIVVSCGLDRHLRVHDVHSKKLMRKIYLKSRLNCVILRDDWLNEAKSANGKLVDAVEIPSESELTSQNGEDNDDVLWDNLTVVGNKRKVDGKESSEVEKNKPQNNTVLRRSKRTLKQ